ncbi:hypothetical protein H0E87_025237, partial [Populus deltoides]
GRRLLGELSVVVAALTVFTHVGGSGGRLVLGWKWRWICGRRRVGAAARGQICRRCWREKADHPASVGDLCLAAKRSVHVGAASPLLLVVGQGRRRRC